MPFRLNEHRAKIQFITSARMPSLIYRACLAKGVASNTRYVQEAVARRLSEDLGIPLGDLLDELPPPRSKAAHLFGPGEHQRRAPAGRWVNEEVK